MSDYQPNLLVSVALFIIIMYFFFNHKPCFSASCWVPCFGVNCLVLLHLFDSYDGQDFLLSVSFQLIAQSFCLAASETLFFHLFVVNYFLVWLFYQCFILWITSWILRKSQYVQRTHKPPVTLVICVCLFSRCGRHGKDSYSVSRKLQIL